MKHRSALSIFLSVVVFIGASAVFAADGGQESPFALGSGARALGMGGGITALAHDASAVFYNPAGLPRLQYQEFAFMHVTLFEGTIYDVASWVYPVIGVGGFGASFMRVGTNDIVRRVNFIEDGTFSAAEWQFLLAYGRSIGKAVSVGASLKIVNQSLDGFSDYGIGMDLGVQTRIYRNLRLGVMARNLIPPRLTLDTTTEDIPRTLVTGLALSDMKIGDQAQLTVTGDLEKFQKRVMKFHGGVELKFFDHYALRGGYDRDNLSFGAGIRTGRFRLDYAYKIMDYIEDSHRLSLSIAIGSSVADQLKQRENAEQERGTALLASERKRQFQSFSDKADAFYSALRLDSALTYYQRALAFDEKNQTILGTIAAIENVQKIKAEQERKLLDAQHEMEQTVNTYFEQANFLYIRKYYPAANDLLNLILDIDSTNSKANALKIQIRQAITDEIAAKRLEAQSSEKAGHVLAAIEAYNRILELAPNDTEAKQGKQRMSAGLDLAQQLRGAIDLFNKGQVDDARRQFEAVLRIKPDEPVALDYLGRMEPPEAQPSTLEALQKDKDIWPLYLEGLRHMRNKEYQEAIDAWNKVLQKYPNNSNTIENIKQARLRMTQ
jgi:tetratricopeptide (TPR) repeat protein